MDCEKCGADVPGGANFCPSCGAAAVSGRAPGEEAAGAAPSFQPAGPPPGPVPPPTGFHQPPPVAPPYQQGQYRYVRNNPLCVAALVLGIASVVFLCGWFFGLGIAAAGIVCAVMGKGQVDQNPEAYTGRNLAQAGLVLSIIGAALNIIWNVVWLSRAWLWR